MLKSMQWLSLKVAGLCFGVLQPGGCRGAMYASRITDWKNELAMMLAVACEEPLLVLGVSN